MEFCKLNTADKVKYLNEDNKFGYYKLDEVKFTKSMDKKKESNEDDNDSM